MRNTEAVPREGDRRARDLDAWIRTMAGSMADPPRAVRL